MSRSNSIFSLLLISLLGSTHGAIMSNDTVVDCPFECLNDSVCGTCDGNGRNGGMEVCRDGNTCVCPEGFEGLRCGRKYESCYDSEHHCQNGGKCIDGMDKFQNTQHFCDCSSAKDSDDNAFVGKYCHLQAVVKCDDNGDKFCVEGAECNDDGSCKCRNDFEGEHCEFRKGSVPECDLKCENAGKCVLGIDDYAQAILGYSDFWKAHEEAMHCLCPQGSSGVRCEIQSEKCGGFDCFNGGKCVEMDSADEKSYKCDCTTGTTSGTSFAGTYCQYEATSHCKDRNVVEGTDFCVNDGICKKDEAGCNCPDGFTGPLCEYNKTLVKEDITEGCNLKCENDGVCSKGAKDQAFISKSKIDDLPQQTGQYNENFEHCICKKGFFGLTCDKEVDVCHDEKHICLNGSTCAKVVTDGKVDWTCDCDVASTPESRFAGISCQHEASQYCTQDGKPGEGVDEIAFCVNGGLCEGVADGSGNPGCQCPDKFQGNHCQYPVDRIQANLSNDNNGGKRNSGFNVALTTCLSFALVLGIAFYVRRRRNCKEADSLEDTLQELEKAMESPTSTTLSENDGSDLRNIELL